MKAITAFEASDGSLHPTEEACQRYEKIVADLALREEFLNSPDNPYPRGPQFTMVDVIIDSWEAFKAMRGK